MKTIESGRKEGDEYSCLPFKKVDIFFFKSRSVNASGVKLTLSIMDSRILDKLLAPKPIL